jgi:hypothetical protein
MGRKGRLTAMTKRVSKTETIVTDEKTSKPWLFGPGNNANPRGRPKGARCKLSEDFMKAMSDDFAAHGVAVIAKVRQKQPARYLEVIARLQPKEIDLNAATPLSDWSLDEVVTVLERMREEVRTGAPDGRMN